MKDRIYFKDESFEKLPLIGFVKNRPTGLAIIWFIGSLLMICKGVFYHNYWFLFVIGSINMVCALIIFIRVKQYTTIRVYEDKIVLTDRLDHEKGILIDNEQIKDWEIEKSEGNALIINLMDGNQINYPITQAGKVNNLLMKTIGNKEKNEKEMAQFRQNNDEVILGIKDIKKIMNKRNKKHEEKY